MKLPVVRPRCWALAFALLLTLAGCGPRFVPPTGVEMAPVLEWDRFVARDGVALPLYRWTPTAEPRAVVLALHSFGDFGLAFEELGPRLAEHGLMVVAFDQRGFGAAPEPGRWWGTGPMVADAQDALDLLKEAYPDQPVHLLGESMGGAVAMLAADEERVDRLVLVAPAVRAELPFRPLWDLGFATAATVAPGYTQRVDHTTPDLTDVARRRLGSDSRVIRDVRADTYWGLLRLANAASALPPTTLPPTLLIFGTEDGTVPEVSLCALAGGLDAEAAVRLHPGAGHRVLHEAAGRDARSQALAWFLGDTPEPEDDGAVGAFCAAR